MEGQLNNFESIKPVKIRYRYNSDKNSILDFFFRFSIGGAGAALCSCSSQKSAAPALQQWTKYWSSFFFSFSIILYIGSGSGNFYFTGFKNWTVVLKGWSLFFRRFMGLLALQVFKSQGSLAHHMEVHRGLTSCPLCGRVQSKVLPSHHTTFFHTYFTRTRLLGT